MFLIMEIENKIAEEFCRNVRRFGRDNGLSGKQMMERLKMAWENYEHDESDVESTHSSLIEQHDGIDENDIKDFRVMWEMFVNKTIEYINEHENVQMAIDDKRMEVMKDWEKRDKELFEPDIRLNFNVDGIDGLLKDGEWTPYTDSTISLMVGTYPIISYF